MSKVNIVHPRILEASSIPEIGTEFMTVPCCSSSHQPVPTTCTPDEKVAPTYISAREGKCNRGESSSNMEMLPKDP